MQIQLEDIGRRFNREWIFRHVNQEFNSGDTLAVIGGNGSGKSTLLQILSGYLSPSEGRIIFTNEAGIVSPDDIFRHVAIAAPYVNIPEDFNLHELINFQRNLKPFLQNMNSDEIISKLDLEKHATKAIRFFSSGMKQRVRLGMAILSNASIVLLDEPTSNLDDNAISWFQKLCTEHQANRLTVIFSNHKKEELAMTSASIDLSSFK